MIILTGRWLVTPVKWIKEFSLDKCDKEALLYLFVFYLHLTTLLSKANTQVVLMCLATVYDTHFT